MNSHTKPLLLAGWALAVFGIALLPSCTTRNAYRTIKEATVREHLAHLNAAPAYTAYQHTIKGKVVEVKGRDKECLERYSVSNFWLGHVEMTEYGTYQDHHQMSLIEQAVEHDTRSGNGMFKNGITVVVYVHGWFNNAAENNGNLNHFRDLLCDIAAEQKLQKRGVLGIYLSWRGESVKKPLGVLTTYWGRARTADKIGSGIMVETLARIRNIHWLVSAGAGKGELSNLQIYNNSRLVLIGHSFGARALYGAVGQGMETNFLQPYWAAKSFPMAVGKSKEAQATMKLVPGFGDLVLLINPAMNSLPYRKLHFVMQSNGTVNYDAKQPVLMMVLSSTNDVPNKSLLPIGETIGNRFRDWFVLRQVKTEAKQNLTALGHFDSFHTHTLLLDEHNRPVLRKIPGFFKPVDHDQNGEVFNPPLPVKVLHSDKLHFLGKASEDQGLLPFMMVSVASNIINGHNGFWPEGHDHSQAYDFVRSFVSAQNKAVSEARSQQAAPAAQRVLPQAY